MPRINPTLLADRQPRIWAPSSGSWFARAEFLWMTHGFAQQSSLRATKRVARPNTLHWNLPYGEYRVSPEMQKGLAISR